MIFFKSNKLITSFRLLVISILSVFLSGCIGMGSKFDCNVDSGGKCAPMHHINQMANYGVFNEKPKVNNQNPILAENRKDAGIKKNETPIRSNEKIQQIWIGPYEDTNGNYHEAAYVYAVVKKGGWIDNPISAITE